jgi:hypothetical protein
MLVKRAKRTAKAERGAVARVLRMHVPLASPAALPGSTIDEEKQETVRRTRALEC